jgi:SAM-dependent methyltransferase
MCAVMVSRLPADVLDPRFYDHLGEVPGDLFDDRLYWSVELVERYAREWAVDLVESLDLWQVLEASGDAGATAAGVVERRRLEPGIEAAVAWILEQLAATGLLHAAGTPTSGASGSSALSEGSRRFRPAAPLRPSHRRTVREAALDHHPDNEPFLDLIDAAGEALPRIARGECTGEAALLGAAGIGRWARYFSNDNPVYALNNRLAAVAAVNRLPDPSGPGARLLEVGAGAGSGSAALLELLEDRDAFGRVERFAITEPAALLRRRAGRSLPRRWPPAETGVELSFGDLDIDRPWAEQGPGDGFSPGSVDLVYGVNVFHVAKNLEAALREAHTALAPGGWLVAGECLRPRPGQPVAAELPFLLLEGFRDVELDPELRPHPGFMTPELWVANLERVGFDTVDVVPDVRVLRDYYPGITTGVVCGRRG